MTRTNPNLPWAGWSTAKPSYRERTVMKKNCGSRCFLGPKKSFPICSRGTCEVNDKGVWAAYVRAREWGSKNKKKKSGKHSQKVYQKVAQKSRKMLKKRGYDVGKTLRKSRMRMRMRRGGDGSKGLVAVEDGAALNKFFGNIGVNHPATPDESLFVAN